MKNRLNKKISTKLLLATSWMMLSFSSCNDNNPQDQDNDKQGNVVKLNLEPNETFQQIDHFGASDAWSGQFVGAWSDAKKNAIADLLFSQEIDAQGNPKGIGLSLWRFNLGAGSAAQGSDSGIGDEWRRASSVMDAQGQFSPERQAAQLWLAQAAKERSVDHLLVFLNSPPVWLTRNGKAFASNANESNLASEQYDAFGEYMAKAIQGIEQEGLKVDYISPINEPQWDWIDGGQEGTPFWNHEIAGIVRALDKKLEENGLSTKIDIAESGQIEYLYEVHNRPGRSNQIADFFTPGSDNYIADLKHLSNNISGHSYFTTSPFQMAVSKRNQLAQAMSSVPGLKYWMSEYCILGDNDGEIQGNGKDLGITPALYMARVIHNDLTIAQASAWHWWIGISPYDYKDGLVYISKSKTDGTYETSKMLWALGNYSKFIRPGFVRVGLTIEQQQAQDQNLLCSAYKNPQTGELVIVAINSSTNEVNIELPLSGDYSNSELQGYLTDHEHDLASYEIIAGEPIKLPARSILTLITQN
ncbi:glycoside hydrolase [Belliella kenyensis]|uniref:Glycoside hydrolase n=1 Tax=Belliella kenyensis TaxID=1472724 RepID=A0ABV8EEW7_9BACT|nr:glycoside hydrolase [Belliella kenyensis]MCH7401872.1 xylanase [Belliella kenyensis]MDN3604372.1 glycoside hydrolase [Belliella kenyensis]